MNFGEITKNFETVTYEELLKQKLKLVAVNQDKRESSVIYNAIAANSAETAQMYMDLYFLENRTYADTATGIDLDRRAVERGLIRYGSSSAILKAVFKTTDKLPFDIPINSMFSGDECNYIVTEKISTGEFKIMCETSGEVGNRYFGRIVPIEYIKDLASAEIIELLIPGENTETDEHFRERYFDSFGNQAFGGNIADYKQKTNSIPGVGSTKVYPVWNGGGTVKLVILDSTYNVPSLELINTVQTIIDPEVNHGLGYGLAPIGHVVTVEGALNRTINLTTKLTFQGSYTWEDIKIEVLEAINIYFESLKKDWDKLDNIIVRISHIEMKILNVAGVVDIENTRINNSSENIILNSNEIPILGDVINQ